VRSIQVFVTDQASGGNPDWKSLAILKSFQSVDVLFWPDVSTDSSNAVTLARLLNGLRPRLTFVVNSRVGLNMVAKFGRGLSQNSRLFCAYFSLGVQAVGPTFGNRFPRYTLPFAAALTDNELTAATLRSRYCKLHAHDVVVLPPQVTPASDDEFNGRLTSRRCRSAGVARQLRWVWVGRIESWKGTRILSKLARLRPLDRFELFGPIFQSLADFELAQQNVFHFGELESVLEADMSNYDGFLFTSLFEGMPNVVLEMSQHAIPLVLTKVGGLPETFNEEAVFFVGIGNEEDTATAFSAALDQVSSLLPEAATTMAIAARNQALRRHSPAAFQHNVTTLFGR
jgi:glycosyltransferase involved in cell wall biosynthesis